MTSDSNNFKVLKYLLSTGSNLYYISPNSFETAKREVLNYKKQYVPAGYSANISKLTPQLFNWDDSASHTSVTSNHDYAVVAVIRRDLTAAERMTDKDGVLLKYKYDSIAYPYVKADGVKSLFNDFIKAHKLSKSNIAGMFIWEKAEGTLAARRLYYGRSSIYAQDTKTAVVAPNKASIDLKDTLSTLAKFVYKTTTTLGITVDKDEVERQLVKEGKTTGSTGYTTDIINPKAVQSLVTFFKGIAKNSKSELQQTISDIPFIIGMILDTISGNYDNLSSAKFIASLGAIIYFVSPLDIIPDSIPVIGAVDDIAILTAAVSSCASETSKYRTWYYNRHPEAREEEDTAEAVEKNVNQPTVTESTKSTTSSKSKGDDRLVGVWQYDTAEITVNNEREIQVKYSLIKLSTSYTIKDDGKIKIKIPDNKLLKNFLPEAYKDKESVLCDYTVTDDTLSLTLDGLVYTAKRIK